MICYLIKYGYSWYYSMIKITAIKLNALKCLKMYRKYSDMLKIYLK